MSEALTGAFVVILFVFSIVAENRRAREDYYKERVEKLRKRQKRRLLQQRRLTERDK
jgi:hypothetical protein